MSTAVFPSLPGLAFPVQRTEIWSDTLQESVSGKRTSLSFWSYPRHQWDLSYEYLKGDPTSAHLQSLMGFFNLRQGRADTFLYADADDNSVTAQQIATGDGSTQTFQLCRTFGGFTEPIYAPHTVSNVYLNGVNQASGWSVSNWGTSTPGVITFASAPGNGVVITATFTYYFPCRFSDPSLQFEKFLYQLWDAKKVTFTSEK